MITLVGNIRTSDGTNMLTAVNGGGLGPNNAVALNTNRTVASSWETFNLVLLPGSPPIGPGMKFALKTSDGNNYLTAVNGGGMGGANNVTCPVHTDQTNPGPWELFTLLVNNSVNPATVQIMPYTTNSLATPFFVTAVNGGGIGDGGANTTPVHTDATSIGPWEQFSFTGSIINNQPPGQVTHIPFTASTNVNITGLFGITIGNIAGNLNLVIGSDGSYSFSGNENNSAWVPEDVTIGVLVLGADKTPYSFVVSGSVGANIFGSNNNWNWSQTGNNATLQSKWKASFGAGGYYWWWNIQASLDVPVIISGLVSAAQQVVGAVQAVVPVVEALAS
jgi:hypothetical protein